MTMDWHLGLGVDWAELIHRFADHVDHTAERLFSNRHRNGTAHIDGLHATHHSVSRFHSDATHAALSQVLLYFEDNVNLRGHVEALAGHAQGLIDRWQRRFGKLHV